MFAHGLLRTAKRRLQEEFAQWLVMTATKVSGLFAKDTLIASGPEPVEASSPYRRHGIGQKIILTETDRKQYLIARRDLSKHNLNEEDNIKLFHNDIIKVGCARIKSISGFDLDINCAFSFENRDRTLNMLEQVEGPFWVRTTDCLRPVGLEALNLEKILVKRELFLNGWRFVDEISEYYNDQGPMYMWQAVFKPMRRKPSVSIIWDRPTEICLKKRYKDRECTVVFNKETHRMRLENQSEWISPCRMARYVMKYSPACRGGESAMSFFYLKELCLLEKDEVLGQPNIQSKEDVLTQTIAELQKALNK